MGLFNNLLGLESDVDPEKIQQEVSDFLVEGEQVEVAFSLWRDQMIFTDRRVLFIDKQGVTGRKRQLQSVPYKSITMYEVETAGTFDSDCDLKIWISGRELPLSRELRRGANVKGIQRALSNGVLI